MQVTCYPCCTFNFRFIPGFPLCYCSLLSGASSPVFLCQVVLCSTTGGEHVPFFLVTVWFHYFLHWYKAFPPFSCYPALPCRSCDVAQQRDVTCGCATESIFLSVDITVDIDGSHSGVQAREFVLLAQRKTPELRPLALVLKQFLSERGAMGGGEEMGAPGRSLEVVVYSGMLQQQHIHSTTVFMLALVPMPCNNRRIE